MKRILFILTVLAVAAGISYLSFFDFPDGDLDRVANHGADLDDSVKFTEFSTGAAKSFPGKKVPNAGYLRLSPISGVAYDAESPPKNLAKTVSIGKGLYFFRLGDIFKDVVVEHPDFRIRTLGRGNFYVDTRNPQELKIFSVSALLTADLLNPSDGSPVPKSKTGATADPRVVTTAHVFPSTYFGYDPSYNTQLKDADILRISTVNTVRYVDLREPTGDDPVLGKDEAARAFFAKAMEYERSQAKTMQKAYDSAFRLSEKLEDTELAEDFGWYFVNDKKKAVILKSRLLRSLRNVALSERCEVKCAPPTAAIAELAETMSAMEELDPELKRYALSAIRQAYYLSYYQAFERGDAYFSSKTSNAFVTTVARTTPGIKVENGDYGVLSEILTAYYYGNKTPADVDRYLNSYVQSLLTGKVIRKSEFLPFSFFLKEYLSRNGFVVSTTALDIAHSLVSVSNEYYETLSTDEQRFSTLTVLYYTYSKIADRIRNSTVSEFFEKKEDGLHLKPEYLDEASQPKLPEGFVESYDQFLKAFSTQYAKNQRQIYVDTLAKSAGRRVADTLSVFERSLGSMREQHAVFNDYGSYLQRLSLDEAARTASGLILEKTYPSVEEIREYFSRFSGLDAARLQVTNDFRKDGYYQVEVPISGRDFSFQVIPDEGYLIQNLTYVLDSQKVDKFVDVSVSLEKKREEYDMLLNTVEETDPRRQFYVFDNYFINAYLTERSSVVIEPDTGEDPQPVDDTDNNTLVWIQDNLIRKDFSNLTDFFPIKIENIKAKIVDKTWNIELSGIRKSLAGGGGTYTVQFASQYVFDKHAFYRLNFSFMDSANSEPMFGGLRVTISPRSIPLADLRTRLNELYPYAATIYLEASKNAPQSAVIDFASKKVVIDGKDYPVVFSNQ